MTQGPDHRSLIPQLQRLMRAPGVARRHKALAESLVTRFQKPVRVAVLGPNADANALVFGGLGALSGAPDIDLQRVGIDAGATAAAFDGIDIALWCSITFNAAEEALWDVAPDDLKDRSILVSLVSEAAQQSHLPADAPAHDLFADIVTIAVSDGHAALDRLARAVQTRVRQGLQADADNALVLINSCKLPDEEAAPSKPEPATHLPTRAEPPAPMPAAAAAPDTPPPAETPAHPARDTSVLAKAAALLQEHAEALQSESLDDDALVTHVLTSCEALCEQVIMLLEAHADNPDIAVLKDDVEVAHDSVVLMALEGGPGAATDAITTMIQLRKDLQLELAA